MHIYYKDEHPIVLKAIWFEVCRAQRRLNKEIKRIEAAEAARAPHSSSRCSRYSAGGERASVHTAWLDAERGFSQFLADLPPRPPFHALHRGNPFAPYSPTNASWRAFKLAREGAMPDDDTVRDITWAMNFEHLKSADIAARLGVDVHTVIGLAKGGGRRVDCGIYPMPEIKVLRAYPDGARKFTDTHVKQMRMAYERGYALANIARDFEKYYSSVSPGEVRAIVMGETYRDVGGPIAGHIRRERQGTAVYRIEKELREQTPRERRAAFFYEARHISDMRDKHFLLGVTKTELSRIFGGKPSDIEPWLRPGPVLHVDPISGKETVID